jgi:predicted TPR repeat methyltransferase
MRGSLAEHDAEEMALPSYLHPNPALRWMAWRRVSVVARHIREHLPRGGRVMDFGCGAGVLFEEEASRASMVFGVDLVLDAARLWSERRGWRNLQLLHPDEIADRVVESSLDVVVAAEVLEHVEDLDAVLWTFRHVLRPNGVLVASLPTENRAYQFGRRLAGFSGHYHHADAMGLDERIRGASFRRESLEQVPLPGPLSIYWVATYRVTG